MPMTDCEHPNSYYLATAQGLVERPQLKGEETCDVAVVGGGLTGLSAALHLAERGYDLSARNPNRKDDYDHRPALELIQSIKANEERIMDLLGELQSILETK